VDQRVALGGHSVPIERIHARYERSMKLLNDAMAQCHRSVLFDNSYRKEEGAPVELRPFVEYARDENLNPLNPEPFLSKISLMPGVPQWAVKCVKPQV
jgi:hypothetical protein